MMLEPGRSVITSKDQHIGRIILNRPQSLNAMDLEVAQGFADAVRSMVVDPELRVIIIAANGRAFMAGGDLAYFNQAPDRSIAARAVIETVHEALELLSAAPQITLASLKGAVAGGGMSLALGFDLAIAAENTVFNTAYARIGASSDCGGTWVLPRLVGMRKAMEISLFCDNIDAHEAHQLGLINKIVPLDALQLETDKLAHRLAAGAPIAQKHIKRLIRASFDHTQSEHLTAEVDSFVECAASADFGGAIKAFLQKKPFSFEGR